MEIANHLWLKTYDVSSLIIWNQNTDKPITKYKSLGKIWDIYKEANNDEKKFIKLLVNLITNS